MAVGASGPKQKDVILMTGATGALGSELLPLMLRKGYDVVCLVRASDLAAAQRRIHAITGSGHLNLRVVRGDITKSQCGIADADLRQLHEWRITKIFHCAASIDFQDRDAAYSTNVDGVKNVIGLADTLGVRNIIHVSTAYVAGEAKLLRETDLPEPANFRPRNVYEATKQTGEALIRAWARQKDRRYSIIRPSIIVGRKDGSTKVFNTYYGYMYPYYSIAESVRRRVCRRKFFSIDITIRPNGIIDIPLVVRMSDTSTLNLVTIDWAANALLDLIAIPPGNDAYHLVNPKPPRVREVLDASLECLNIDGVILVETDKAHRESRKNQSKLLSVLQDRMDTIHGQYIPYVTFESEFTMMASQRILNNLFREPPSVDEALIRRLLSFAIHSNWGLAAQQT